MQPQRGLPPKANPGSWACCLPFTQGGKRSPAYRSCLGSNDRGGFVVDDSIFTIFFGGLRFGFAHV